MIYRTKTYIAADWTGDVDSIEQLRKWNDSNYWSLSFVDVHEVKQARDSSLNCSIKRSLKERMDVSKTFILIVGNNTKTVSSGACRYCQSYNSWGKYCARGYSVDEKSYIEYECLEAIKARIKIVVLYNSTIVNKDKCPDILQLFGTHVAMVYKGTDGKLYWNYNAVKNAVIC